MKVLVTGDRGYIGSVLTKMLEEKSYVVVGYDIDYYQETDLYPIQRNYKQITKDLRDVSQSDTEGIDAIIHLAGLSNDPLGELNPNLTVDINLNATLKLAKMAKTNNITVNCFNPGFVSTSIGSSLNSSFLGKIVFKISRIFAKSSTKGAETAVYLASSPEVSGITGEYFLDCKIAKTSKAAKSEYEADRLWKISSELSLINFPLS